MISDIEETQGTICPVCEKEVLFEHSRYSDIIILTKVIRYYDTFKTTHFNCALKFSKLIDKTYKLETETYANGTSSPLLCMNYHKNCFHCDQKHTNANDTNVILYVKCKQTWCCDLNKTKKHHVK